MNIERIRQQMKEIQIPDIDIKNDVLLEIKKRSTKRKRSFKIATVVALLMMIIGFIQFDRIIVIAGSAYKNIQLVLNHNSFVIEDEFAAIPIEVDNLDWVGKMEKRVGTKEYMNIDMAENELNIHVLRNMMHDKSAFERQVSFLYFEEHKMAQLLLNEYIIGDLENVSEMLLENGDRQFSYLSSDHTVYKSPVSMSVIFFTETDNNYEMNNLEKYNYEEKYTSTANGITAYILDSDLHLSSKENTLLSNAAGTATGKMAVFVHDNLFYIMTGHIPTVEMKNIIDSFIIEE